ncbi:hypothetical protein [Chryseobacterium sp. c4a]|uniref:hypothetical protein n=1 Tax=Chryseobacterium sp. c4a TaxID=1573582 RepID=UPI0013568592|nr:hypothetical protein [Chryseobacterium sp. c4a]
MKYLKLLLFFLAINSCKGQKDISDLTTTWYEIKKQGNIYIIIDCGYEGESFKIENDSIYDHGIMEDSVFKLHHVVSESDITSIYINEKEKYEISWIDKTKGIIKRINNIDDNIVKYYVNKTNLNKIKKVKGNSKDCITNEDFEDSVKTLKDKKWYSADGTWKTNCTDGEGSITIEGKKAFLVLLSNQIYLELVEMKRYDFEKGIAYKLKEIPEDVGTIGMRLDWKEYLNDEPVAYIKNIDNNRLNFYWYGFYNKKTKKREFKDNNFYQETESKDIVLKKCNN